MEAIPVQYISLAILAVNVIQIFVVLYRKK